VCSSDLPNVSHIIEQTRHMQMEHQSLSLEEYPQAYFFKTPIDNEGNQIDLLAPLIVQLASSEHESISDEQRFGRVMPSSEGPAVIDSDKPTVYKASRTIGLAGHQYEQSLYVWWYAKGDGISRGRGRGREGGSELVPRGIIITFDSEGYPMIWEPYPPTDDWRTLYVSSSLERDVAELLPTLVEGRLHAVESDWKKAPRTFVTRVLSDGPMPMGPYVYLRGTDLRITSVTCRCMDSQIGNYAADFRYEIKPLSDLLDWGCDLAAIGLDWPFSMDDPAAPASVRLDEHLRWPDTLVR